MKDEDQRGSLRQYLPRVLLVASIALAGVFLYFAFDHLESEQRAQRKRTRKLTNTQRMMRRSDALPFHERLSARTKPRTSSAFRPREEPRGETSWDPDLVFVQLVPDTPTTPDVNLEQVEDPPLAESPLAFPSAQNQQPVNELPLAAEYEAVDQEQPSSSLDSLLGAHPSDDELGNVIQLLQMVRTPRESTLDDVRRVVTNLLALS